MMLFGSYVASSIVYGILGGLAVCIGGVIIEAKLKNRRK